MRRLLAIVLLFAFSPLGASVGAVGQSPGRKSGTVLAERHIDNEATGDEFARRHP